MCVDASHAPIMSQFALTNPTINLVCTEFVDKRLITYSQTVTHLPQWNIVRRDGALTDSTTGLIRL